LQVKYWGGGRDPCNPCGVDAYEDSALAHRGRDTIQLLQRETPDFIGPDFWPPNSPDLNPIDYKIWGVMQQRVYESRINSIDELKQRLHDVWHDVQQHIIDLAVS